MRQLLVQFDGAWDLLFPAGLLLVGPARSTWVRCLTEAQVTTFTYDLLGRITGRFEPGLTSTWTHDTATKGKGKLAVATTSNGYSRQHSYDTLSRPSQVTITIDATVSTIATTYDGHGRIDTITYPSGFAVRHVCTSLGYLSEVRNNATNALYWRTNATNASLQLTSQTHGNNVATTQVFDNQTGRLTDIQAGAGASVANFKHEWDTLGNLHTRKDFNLTCSPMVSHGE